MCVYVYVHIHIRYVYRNIYREKGGGKGGKGVEGIYRGPAKGVTFESTGVPQKVGKLTMGGLGIRPYG